VSLNSQLARCHSENRKSLKPVELFMTSLDKRLAERMETIMNGVHHRWKGVHVSAEPYQDVLKVVPSELLVYLTADSANVIHSLEKDKVYIIGGIVDKNRHKVCIPLMLEVTDDLAFMLRQGRKSRYSAWTIANWRLHKDGNQTCIDSKSCTGDYVEMAGFGELGKVVYGGNTKEEISRSTSREGN
jgi:hypothetical protein